ncbi:hypothetical protein, partial [Weizmannia sp. CD-2023]|nr:hypothetical protein [Weizmannia sp. CD-2023]
FAGLFFVPKINEIGKNLPTKVTKIYFMNNQLHLEIHTWENYLLPMFVRFSSRIQVKDIMVSNTSIITSSMSDFIFLIVPSLFYLSVGILIFKKALAKAVEKAILGFH